jgi:hypothetical protein
MATNKKHFQKGSMVACPDGIGADVAITRMRVGWSKKEVTSAIKDSNGTSPSESWLSHVECNRHFSEGSKGKISSPGLKGIVTFLVKQGDSAMRSKYRELYESLPTQDNPFPKKIAQTSAARENLDDRMLDAFEILNDEEKWMIASIAEKLARASKMNSLVSEITKGLE